MSFSLGFGELNTQQTVAVHFAFLFASLDSYCIFFLCAFFSLFPFTVFFFFFFFWGGGGCLFVSIFAVVVLL